MSQLTKKTARRSVKSTKATDKTSNGFTAEERGAMKARVQELKAEARANKSKVEGESAALGAIAAMKEPDRTLAKRVHAIIKANAPDLSPKTWYGMPAYSNRDGKIVCFFRPAEKFKDRYATFGFNDAAKLDEGPMWPTAFALMGN